MGRQPLVVGNRNVVLVLTEETEEKGQKSRCGILNISVLVINIRICVCVCVDMREATHWMEAWFRTGVSAGQQTPTVSSKIKKV